MIIYKEANENDANDISEVIRSTLLSTSAQSYPKSEIDRMLEINTPQVIAEQMKDYYFICAKDNDKVVGVGSVNRTELKRLFVLPEYQRRGIATTIMTQLLNHHKDLYPNEILSLTGTGIAKPLYERFGFRVIREINDSVSGHLYCMILLRSI